LQVFQCDKTGNRSVPSGKPAALSRQAASTALGAVRHLAIRAGMVGSGRKQTRQHRAELIDENIEPPRQAIRGLRG